MIIYPRQEDFAGFSLFTSDRTIS